MTDIALDAPSAERVTFSIDEFCERNGISLFTYYKMQKQGVGPREIRFGSIVKISKAEEADWHRRMSQPSKANTLLKKKLSAHAKRASKAAIASPKHIRHMKQRGRR